MSTQIDKKAIYNLTYGLFVLTAAHGGKDSGCIINTAVQVTSEPNRVSIAVNKKNFTHDLVLADGRFNLSVLGQQADFQVFEHFGFQSGRDVDKFAGYAPCARSENGLYYVTAGTNSYISAAVEQSIDLGSHTLFIARVTDAQVLADAPSVTYAYYQAHIKPQPQTPQPTGKTQWRCTVCGYVYEGEELPPDFVCPWCKHPASDFEKVTN
jgi:flavin reductase (DIM6/NTAB) family NADH-FMN oxidoreductase RutF/rubredoxin